MYDDEWLYYSAGLIGFFATWIASWVGYGGLGLFFGWIPGAVVGAICFALGPILWALTGLVIALSVLFFAFSR